MNKNKMLEILACPQCRGDLDLSAQDRELTCVQCGKKFPIVGGIPRFVEINEKILAEAKKHWEQSAHFQYEAKSALYTKEYYEEQDKWRREEVDPYNMEEYQFDKISGKTVVDIGCGSGWVIKQAARHGAFPVGVDFTEKAVVSTKKALDTYGLEGLVVQADAQHLPIKTEVIDRVYSIGVLHHIPDTEKGVSEAHRVLKKGGTGLISLYGKLFFFNPVLFPVARFFLQLLLNAPQVRDGIQHTTDYDEFCRHLDGPTNPIGRWYTIGELKDLMRQFRIKSIRNSHFPLRYLSLFGIPLKPIVPGFIHQFLEKQFGMMRNMQLEKQE